MASKRRVLSLPVKPGDRDEVSLKVFDDKLVLSDARWGIRVIVWAVMLGVGLLCVPLLINGVTTIMDASSNLSLGSGQRSQKMTQGIITATIGGLGIGLTLFILIGLKMHRRFVVAVVLLRRTCVLHSKLCGITTRRLHVEMDEADWEISTDQQAVVEDRNFAAYGCIVYLLLFPLGPLGWIAGWILGTELGGAPAPLQHAAKKEITRLQLHTNKHVRAVITLRDRTIAERFVREWDRKQTGGLQARI